MPNRHHAGLKPSRCCPNGCQQRARRPLPKPPSGSTVWNRLNCSRTRFRFGWRCEGLRFSGSSRRVIVWSRWSDPPLPWHIEHPMRCCAGDCPVLPNLQFRRREYQHLQCGNKQCDCRITTALLNQGGTFEFQDSGWLDQDPSTQSIPNPDYPFLDTVFFVVIHLPAAVYDAVVVASIRFFSHFPIHFIHFHSKLSILDTVFVSDLDN